MPPPPSHYETLGVARTASIDEIKAAFRKLSKETHPDMTGSTVHTDRFKEISQAASILTNKSKKEAYDLKLSRPLGGHWTHHKSPADAARARQQGSRSYNGFVTFVHTIFRPRNMVLGSIALYTTVTTARYTFGWQPVAPLQHEKALVQAWKNPATGQWEQPAPWDPAYRRLRPKLTMVPREKVKTRNR